jgi:AhpD family alkylhydroperoxidase
MDLKPGQSRRNVEDMTTTDSAAGQAAYVEIPVRFDFDSLAPKASRAVATLHKAAIADLAAAGVEQGLIELVRLRASQLNGCAYCVDTHSADARTAGVSGQRLDMLPVWADAPCYTAGERAALALTESVTRLSETHAPEPVVAEALKALGEAQTAAILALIVSINAWNAIGVASRCWPVGLRAE